MCAWFCPGDLDALFSALLPPPPPFFSPWVSCFEEMEKPFYRGMGEDAVVVINTEAQLPKGPGFTGTPWSDNHKPCMVSAPQHRGLCLDLVHSLLIFQQRKIVQAYQPCSFCKPLHILLWDQSILEHKLQVRKQFSVHRGRMITEELVPCVEKLKSTESR